MSDVRTPAFPGAVGLSHLRVYDSVGSDGLAGGSPHVHAACTESYAVIAGEGAVQTLSSDGFLETPLRAGTFAWFTPGTIHRLVNLDGDLEIFVIMANSGLPEAGDMVLTFPDQVLADPARYWELAVLPEDASTTEGSDAAARSRRDLAVEGFLQLREAVDAHGPTALSGFYSRVTGLLGPRSSNWWDLVQSGPAAEVEHTRSRIRALAAGEISELTQASMQHRSAPAAPRLYGCCGTLGTYL